MEAFFLWLIAIVVIGILVFQKFPGISSFIARQRAERGATVSANDTAGPGTGTQQATPAWYKDWRWIAGIALGITLFPFFGSLMWDAIHVDSEKNQQDIAYIQQLKANNKPLTDAQIAILEGSKSQDSQSKEKAMSGSDKDPASGSIKIPEQEFNWWVLFPFVLALLMLYIIFFTKPKALSLGAVLILIGTLVFFWHYRSWFLPGLDMVGEKLGQPVAISQSANQQAIQQPNHKEDEWTKVNEKTCEIAWNNKDFKEGWCALYQFPPGEYRFKVRSSRVSQSLDGKLVSFSPTGEPIEKWRVSNGYTEFANHFNTWTLIRNGMVGMVIFKTDNEYPTPEWNISITKDQPLYVSINFPATQENWEKMKFKGKITVEIFKKKEVKKL